MHVNLRTQRSLLIILVLAGAMALQAQRESFRIYPDIRLNQQYARFARMAASADGGWAVAEADSATREVRVLRFDECGDIRWARLLDWDSPYRPHWVGGLLFDSTGCLVLGAAYSGSAQRVTHVVKLDPDGAEVWSRSWYAPKLASHPFQMGLLSDDRIFLTGYANPSGVVTDLITVMDGNGDLQSSRIYYQSVAGFMAVGIPLRNGHILMRRGDRMYEVDPDSGDVVWQRWNVAPMYNSSLPVQQDSGFLVVGQFSNSKDLYSGLGVLLNDQGEALSTGDMFRANGGGFGNLENLLIPRVEALPGGLFATLTTDSLAKGILSVVLLGPHAEMVRQFFIYPESGDYRLLNHDFVRLADGRLAIAANANGQLAMITFRPDTTTLCGTTEVFQPVPYSTSLSTGAALDITPVDFPLEEFPPGLVINDFAPSELLFCDSLEMIPDRMTTLSGCPGDSLLADAAFPGASGWIWDDGTTASGVYLHPGDVRTVVVTVNCAVFTHTFEVLVREDCPCPVLFPNVFTPNGDQTNDGFGPVSDCPLAGYRLEIYDRWGKRVFVSSDPSQTWDGRRDSEDLPSDVYGYLVTYRSGTSTRLNTVRGEVTLVR